MSRKSLGESGSNITGPRQRDLRFAPTPFMTGFPLRYNRHGAIDDFRLAIDYCISNQKTQRAWDKQYAVSGRQKAARERGTSVNK